MPGPIVVFEASAVSANYSVEGNSPGGPKMFSAELVDVGSWGGTVKFAAHVRGRTAPGAFVKFLAIKDATTGDFIDGATGITAAGLFVVDPTGWDIEVQHVRTAGSASLYISSNNA